MGGCAPGDFVATTAGELAGTSEIATYGPPYNHKSSSVQEIFGVSWQRIAGVWIPIDAARDFVIRLLSAVSGDDPALRAALARWKSAPTVTRTAWATAYLHATHKLTINSRGSAPGRRRPGARPRGRRSEGGPHGRPRRCPRLPALVLRHRLHQVADLEDGTYFVSKAKAQRLLGTQWRVMNEARSYPGQPWLWLYQLWYHVPAV